MYFKKVTGRNMEATEVNDDSSSDEELDADFEILSESEDEFVSDKEIEDLGDDENDFDEPGNTENQDDGLVSILLSF